MLRFASIFAPLALGCLIVLAPQTRAGDGPAAGYTRAGGTSGGKVQVGTAQGPGLSVRGTFGIGAPSPRYSKQGVGYSQKGKYTKKGYGHGPVVRHRPARRVWIPGHYDFVAEQVWVPGPVHQVWVPPIYETHYDLCGRPTQVQVVPGHWQTVHAPGHHEVHQVRVWRPGHWEKRFS